MCFVGLTRKVYRVMTGPAKACPLITREKLVSPTTVVRSRKPSLNLMQLRNCETVTSPQNSKEHMQSEICTLNILLAPHPAFVIADDQTTQINIVDPARRWVRCRELRDPKAHY